jgi:REP element-mobilizing transposase RayT
MKRKTSKTGIYHVLIRGINQQRIFEDAADHASFMACLKKVKQLSGFKLYAYCLMDNHVHLLLKEGKEGLSQIFRRLGARYVFRFNWRYQRTGHLFQDRFKSEAVETDAYFITVLLYIYQNPVKAGLCKKSQDYKWGSRRFLGKENGLIDETDLLDIVSIEAIKEKERDLTPRASLEYKTGRMMRLPDEKAFEMMRDLSGARDTTSFQQIDKSSQREVIMKLKERGASIRQAARLTGLSKGVIERTARGA